MNRPIIKYYQSILNDYQLLSFPCNKDKTPKTTQWQKIAYNDTDRILSAALLQCLNENTNCETWGIPCSPINNIFVIDIDLKDNGMAHWEETVMELFEYTDPNEYCNMVVKMPSGGLHLYYKYDSIKAPQLRNTSKLTINNVHSGIDIRTAGGYVIGPNSVNNTGTYEPYSDDNTFKDLCEIPDNIFSLIAPTPRPIPRPVPAQVPAPELAPEIAQSVAQLDAKWANDYDAWLKILFICKAHNLYQVAKDFSAKSAKYTEHEFNAKWLSIKDGPSKITLGTIKHYLKQQGRVGKEITLPIEFPTECHIEKYHDQHVHPYSNDYKTTFVYSAPSTGKTKAQLEFIERTKPKTLLQISFRCAFTDERTNKTNGLVDYRTLKGRTIFAPHMIIQLESLHRYDTDINKVPDLLIIDEPEQMLECFRNTAAMNETYNENLIALEWLLKYSKHVLLMDGSMTYRTFDMVRHSRGLENSIVYHNTYQPAAQKVIHPVTNKDDLAAQLVSDLGRGVRTLVATNIEAYAQTLKEMIERTYNDQFKVQVYFGDAGKEVKSELTDVKTNWEKYDCVIYTTTITAGVSYEGTHFGKQYCYFSDTSAGYLACYQMSLRARAINEIYMCTECKKWGALPSTIGEVENHIVDRNVKLLGAGLTWLPSLRLNEQGQRVYAYKDFSYYVIVNNILMYYQSKKNFKKLLLERFVSDGYNIEETEELNAPKVVRKIEQEVNIRNAAEVANIELTVKYEDLDEKVKQHDGLTRAEILMKHKYDFIDFYGIKDKEIVTDKLIAWYDKDRVKRQYMNLKQLSKYVSLKENVNSIKEFVIEKKKLVGCSRADFSINDTIYYKLDTVENILRLIGWDIDKNNFENELEINKTTLINNEALWKYIDDNGSFIGKVFQCSGPSNEFKSKMKFVNYLLDEVFGIKFAAIDNRTRIRRVWQSIPLSIQYRKANFSIISDCMNLRNHEESLQRFGPWQSYYT